MSKVISIFIDLINRTIYRLTGKVSTMLNQWAAMGYLLRKGASVGTDAKWLGGVKLQISPQAEVQIGRGFICRGRGQGIDMGNYSSISVSESARLIIGDYSGMSNTSIHCQQEITIGDHVNIGGGCMIFDTNFHSTNWHDREDRRKDIANRKMAPVHIGDYVFIGARSIICKGITIGDHSIIAAGSVVMKDVPANEVWGGNPARFIRKVE